MRQKGTGRTRSTASAPGQRRAAALPVAEAATAGGAHGTPGHRACSWSTVRCRPSTRQEPGPRRGGFTLLEVLLAVALSAVLLAALYAALHLQYRYWTGLDSRTQQVQLTRSLYAMLQADLRGCVFQPPEQEDSGIPEIDDEGETADGTLASGGTAEQAEVVIAVSDPLSAWGSGLTGLVGTTDVLVLQTAQAQSPYGGTAQTSADAALAAELGLDGVLGLPESPTLRAVAYCVGDAPGGMAFLQSLLDGGATVVGEDADLADLGPLPGLYRVSAPYSVWENAGSDDAPAADFSVTTVERLAPEVRSIGFRYFDGAEWLTEWDSIASGRLPSAVEITLSLRGAAELERLNPETYRTASEAGTDETPSSPVVAGASSDDRTTRFVIWLPAAEAVEAEVGAEPAP